ncbi:UNVERIFIED_CONTAM: hypothetical protein HDU68_009218 [Siphonaria sp. JEL0065]|nr:hypothetical protein HDU68_009218 [Siphonaria sp. JEL0065]
MSSSMDSDSEDCEPLLIAPKPHRVQPSFMDNERTETKRAEKLLLSSSDGGFLCVQRAHNWNSAKIAAPTKNAPFFSDEYGRHVHLRGVNICGQSKLPTAPLSISTHLPTPEFFNHRDVSFIGRPFPLADADEHFLRLKGWGLTFVRLLVTWEALEHQGPGLYDEAFIDYLICILKKAEKHGIKCFIDPHQDTWSRFSGGSGAPGWTFEVAGMDITSFQSVGAAHVHNFNEDVKNPHMFWPTNYAKLACATMFTLFFAGHVLAPDLKYQGVNVGTFLQEKYIACYTHLARRLKNCNAVVGFEFMNEPHYGYIGLSNINKFDPMLFFHYGPFPSALQSFALGSGMEVDVDFYTKSWPVPSRKAGTRTLNSEKRSAWLNYGDCVWKRHGVWAVNSATGKLEILKPDYFVTNPATGESIEFYKDFYMPMVQRYKNAIRAVRSDHLIFFEPIPNEDPPELGEEDREEPNYVYAPHWYDLKALLTKNFDGLVTFDVQGLARGTKNVLTAMYFGLAGAEANYTGQMRNIVNTGKRLVGHRAILMGECGIPMDINEKQAYLTGNYNTHNNFLDTVIRSMETNLLNFTLWNYNPGNDNVHGDHWNGEDFSIYSPNASVQASRSGSPSNSRSASPVLGRQELKSTPQPTKLSNVVTAPSPSSRSTSTDSVPSLIKPRQSQPSLASRRSSTASLERIPTSPFEITGLTFHEGPLEGDPNHFHHVGGRALDAVIRPYASKIPGTPTHSRFDLENLIYTLEFTTIYNPKSESISEIKTRMRETRDHDYNKRYCSEVFVPNFHYKFEGMRVVVTVSDGEWKYDQEKQSLVWHYDPLFRNTETVGDGGIVKHRLTVSTPLSIEDGGSNSRKERSCFGWFWGAFVAHEWGDTIVKAPIEASPFFQDQFGRKVHLRGVNMCGHSKLPTVPVTASTHLNSNELDFFSHKSVSFVGRPFPLADADEHFCRVKGWGLSFVRLLVTWEALEHEGPGIYDEAFIDYLILILEKAHKHGIKCFIDPHQDTWSRFSGGSGAPGWTFEVAGMDITAFDAVGAAHVHNFNDGVKNPHQYWPTNYGKLACATMFTLFFGGNVFAPNTKYNGINVSTFLQEKYIACYTHLARRIKSCKSVVGFELMNEPHYGYIGLPDLKQFDQNTFLHYGKFPSPLQSFALGSGMAVNVDYYVPSWPVPSRKAGTKLMNEDKRSAWLEYGECVWKKHGVWGLDDSGNPKVLKPDYFTTHPLTGKPIDFYSDFYMPLMRKYTAAIQSVNIDHLVFFEPIPNEDPPILNELDRVYPNLVYSPHWYDLKALWSKSFDEKVTFDIQALARGTKNVLTAMYLGSTGAERNYTNQMRTIMQTGKLKVGDRPVLMGECGIPMDFNEKKAYETGDYTRHNIFLDAVISSMEANMFNFTLWNYNPDNDNVFGDHWNGEDFSIFSLNASKLPTPKCTPKFVKSNAFTSNSSTPTVVPNPVALTTPPSTTKRHTRRTSARPTDHIPGSPFEITGISYINEPMEGDPTHSHHIGGRALDAAIRPYAAKIAGTPVSSKFNLSKLTYTLEFTTCYDSTLPSITEMLGGPNSPIPKMEFITEVFIPNFQYKIQDAKVSFQVSDGDWRYDQEKQTLVWHYDPAFVGSKSRSGACGVVKDGELVHHRLVVSVPGLVSATQQQESKGVLGFVKGLYHRRK